MVGFASGLAQGFGNFGDDLAADRVRREESQIRQIGLIRQAKLDQQKEMGDILKQYNSDIENMSDDQAQFRTNLLFQQIEQATGQKPNAEVMKIIKADPKQSAGAMTSLYASNPYSMQTFGSILSNPTAFAGFYSAAVNRENAKKGAEAFAEGLQPQIPAGTAPAEAIQMRIDALNNAMTKLQATGRMDKNAVSFYEKNMGILNDQKTQALTGNTEAQKNNAAFIPPAMAAQLGLPINTTMGQLGQGGAQSSPVAPQAVQGTPMPAASANQRGGFSAVPAKGSTPPAILDNLRSTESSGNTFAINKDTKAMGPYQFIPETLAAMTRAGISFNPFDEPQARDAADRYITMLTAQNGGDIRKALAQYGGFVTKDPSAYVNKVMKGVSDGAAQPNFGNRPDGTPKGTGFLGVLARPDGNVSTEVSVGVNIGGKEMDIPLLVPTLTQDEINTVLSTPNDKQIPESIVRKAAAFAKERIAQGKSVFAQPGEGPGMQGAAQPQQRSLVPPTEAEQKQSVAQAEQSQKDFAATQQAGMKAGKRARDLQNFMTVLEKSGETGTFATSKLGLQKIAKGLGFEIPDSSSYAEAAKGMAVPLYLALRDTSEGGGLPGQMVTYEEQLLQSAFPGLEKLPGANKIMADIMIQNDKRTEAVAKELRDYVRGTTSFDGSPKKAGFVDSGLFDVAQKYKEDHPIISPENLKKLQDAAGGSVVRKKTPTASDNRPPLNSFFK